MLVVFSLTITPQSAVARSRDFSSYFLDIVPTEFVAAAFSQPYGQAVVTQFTAALRDSADPMCLQAKKVTEKQLQNSAHALLLERGVYMLERLISMTDRKVFKSYLHARIGRDGISEFERLRKDPAVLAYLAADEPAEHAFIAQYIVEMIVRYAKIMRISFASPFSPLSSEIPSLNNVDPTGKIDVELKKMIADDSSGALARYLEIFAIAQKPYRDAVNMDLAREFGPGELLARAGKDNRDLYNELADLCVTQSATTRR